MAKAGASAPYYAVRMRPMIWQKRMWTNSMAGSLASQSTVLLTRKQVAVARDGSTARVAGCLTGENQLEITVSQLAMAETNPPCTSYSGKTTAHLLVARIRLGVAAIRCVTTTTL